MRTKKIAHTKLAGNFLFFSSVSHSSEFIMFYKEKESKRESEKQKKSIFYFGHFPFSISNISAHRNTAHIHDD